MELNLKIIQDLKNKILKGKYITKEEALLLCNQPLKYLAYAANEIRGHFCGTKFDVCSIVNAKSGMCSEDCKYCAQSVYNLTEAQIHDLLEKDEIVKLAKYNSSKGIIRFSIVTSGKKISNKELDQICDIITTIKTETSIRICTSLGLLNESQFTKLKDAGVTRIHNNLETSRNHFQNICTTHTYEDKIASIKAAKNVGLNVCSGGIMGLGENMEDRIDMAFELRDLDISSIPINILNPIKGTPLENNKILSNDELCRIVAIYRFILPNSYIRLAGGRGLLSDKGLKCFQSGSNAAISGDMLTTKGISIDYDMTMIKKLGYNAKYCNN
jgi:biotin synthase